MYKNNASLFLGSLLIVLAGMLWLIRPSVHESVSASSSSQHAGAEVNKKNPQKQATALSDNTGGESARLKDTPSVLTAKDHLARADQMLGTVFEVKAWDSLFEAWVKEDLDGALLWIEQNTGDSDRDFYEACAGKALMAYDFDAAGEALLYEPAFNTNAALIRDYAAKLAALDDEHTSFWLSEILDSEAKAAAEFAVFEYRLANQPEQAFQQVLEQRWLFAPTEFDAYLGQAAFAEAQTTESPATAWVSQYPEELQSLVAYNWAAGWANEKSDVMPWLKSLNGTDVKDSALHGVLDFGKQHYAAEDQVALVSALSGQDDRKNTLNELLENWAATDRQAVRAYLNGPQQLPSEEAEWLLQRLEAVL